MWTDFKPLSAALLIGLASPAFAQDTETPAEPEAPSEAQTEEATETPPAINDEAGADTPADPADGFDMGRPAGEPGAADGQATEGEPRIGEEYIASTSGDWSIRCLKREEGQQDPCSLYQLLRDANDNAVSEISIIPLPEGSRAAAGATIITPLETLLSEDLTLTVDGGQPRTYEFTFCNRGGCVSRVGFTQAEIDQFKRGNGAVLTMVPAGDPNQKVELTVSLSGFTAGFDSLEIPAAQ
ncbi:invasion associated locus B family protein [Aestuariibius insulae]|uniref:invasion associated locus B family protein n=1 Tax=Aestuariibius insulae TaxID=2058287 RepID=UPI00345E80E4